VTSKVDGRCVDARWQFYERRTRNSCDNAAFQTAAPSAVATGYSEPDLPVGITKPNPNPNPDRRNK